MAKRIVAPVYTHGRFGKGWREALDTDNPFLYSGGVYPTKITELDLPEHYIDIHSRVIWYMHGHLKTSGIVDMGYKYAKFNHLFKDDYIYISYHEKLIPQKDEWGFEHYTDYDVCVCGNDIIDIVLASEIYSGFDSTEVRKKIEEKRVWLRDNHPDEYESAVGEEDDIFDIYIRKGYVADRLVGGR